MFRASEWTLPSQLIRKWPWFTQQTHCLIHVSVLSLSLWYNRTMTERGRNWEKVETYYYLTTSENDCFLPPLVSFPLRVSLSPFCSLSDKFSERQKMSVERVQFYFSFRSPFFLIALDLQWETGPTFPIVSFFFPSHLSISILVSDENWIGEGTIKLTEEHHTLQPEMISAHLPSSSSSLSLFPVLSEVPILKGSSHTVT